MLERMLTAMLCRRSIFVGYALYASLFSSFKASANTFHQEKSVAITKSNVADVFYNNESSDVRAELAVTLAQQAITSVTARMKVCG